MRDSGWYRLLAGSAAAALGVVAARVQRLLLPEIYHPNTGNAVYVFEPPDRRS